MTTEELLEELAKLVPQWEKDNPDASIFVNIGTSIITYRKKDYIFTGTKFVHNHTTTCE
jgi:hypothetical protein